MKSEEGFLFDPLWMTNGDFKDVLWRSWCCGGNVQGVEDLPLRLEKCAEDLN